MSLGVGLNYLLFSVLWEWYEETLETVGDGGNVTYAVEVEHTTHRGRPRFIVSVNQLEYLRSLSFSWTTISSCLGVTHYCLLAECGLL